MTPDQALAILENFQNASPADRQALCNSIALAAPVWAKQAANRDGKIVSLIKQLNTKVQALIVAVTALNGGTPVASDAPESSEPEAAAFAPPAAGERFNKDGTPMSAADAAVEDEMDAATSGQGMNPNAPPPSVVPLPFVPDDTAVEVEAAPTPQIVAPRARNGSAQPKA